MGDRELARKPGCKILLEYPFLKKTVMETFLKVFPEYAYDITSKKEVDSVLGGGSSSSNESSDSDEGKDKQEN